jgi:hypothetical protein
MALRIPLRVVGDVPAPVATEPLGDIPRLPDRAASALCADEGHVEGLRQSARLGGALIDAAGGTLDGSWIPAVIAEVFRARLGFQVIGMIVRPILVFVVNVNLRRNPPVKVHPDASMEETTPWAPEVSAVALVVPQAAPFLNSRRDDDRGF